MPQVAITGATGFVGRHLIQKLQNSSSKLIGISRRSYQPLSGIEWRQADLFSLLQAEMALKDADVAIYLVHSMLPSARLTQAKFEEMDLIAADNFARAAKLNGVKQIIYLGGLIPNSQIISRHLQSRLEVERTLSSHGIPVTSFRAGLIVGTGGSSFLMLKRLVERLPVMLIPSWVESKTQAVDIRDVTSAIEFSVLNPQCYGQIFDLGCGETISYANMIRKVGQSLNRNPKLIRLPFIPPKLSRLWVSLVTGFSRELVGPLVESLNYSMLPADKRIFELSGKTPIPFQESIDHALRSKNPPLQLVASGGGQEEGLRNTVRSVQRMHLPKGMRAQEVALLYLQWLSGLFFGMIRVEVNEDGECRFFLRFLKRFLLLRLVLDPSRSQIDRQLFRIVDGFLVKTKRNGRFEFREVLGGKFLIAAIHDFEPRLPWYVYNLTQAKAHLWVMKKFSKYLESICLAKEGDSND